MSDPESKQDSGISSYGKALRAAGPLLTSGIQFALSVGVLCLIGYLLDREFKTTPWLMVAGIFVGAAAGFYIFLKTIQEAEKRKNAHE